MAQVWDFITRFFSELSGFWTWLLAPIEELGNIKPIEIISIGGFVVILGFWIFKLVNPLS